MKGPVFGLVPFNISIDDLDDGLNGGLIKYAVEDKLGGLASLLENRIRNQNGLDKVKRGYEIT